MAIRDQPHYEIPAGAFADWVECDDDRWWSVDGDPVLTGRITFPCPGDELAAELRRLGRPVLVLDRRTPPQARGEVADASVLDALATDLGDSLVMTDGSERPDWARDRLWDLAWKGSGIDWILSEDTEAAAAARSDAAQAQGAT
jgi:hypothetical protein